MGRKPGRKPGAPRADKAEKIRRIGVIEDMLTMGLTELSIKVRLSSEWGITRDQIGNYIQQARREWARAKDIPRAEKLATVRRQAQLIFRQGVAKGKLSAAATGLRMSAAIDGIATDRVEHTGAGGGPIAITLVPLDLSKLSDAQLAALGEISAALSAAPPPPTEETKK